MENIGEYQYNPKDLIGHGAFAIVFKGQLRKDPSQKVAIKSIKKKNIAKSTALLSKEIKILRELSQLKHENVVTLLECKETTQHVYLVMEYCNGGDLADYLQAKGTLSEDTIALFLRQIAAALRALVAKDVVHRDLKPQNILLCHNGQANPPPHTIRLKIADFGFARFLQDGVMAGTLCGSPMYMAPEVIMSLQYCAKADLWSVGTIVYQCLTGKAPFQASTPQQLKQYYELNASLAPSVPRDTSPALSDLLLRMLKRNARDRIDFADFFSHPFIAAPAPAPQAGKGGSVSESPPPGGLQSLLSASPLSGLPPPPVPSRHATAPNNNKEGPLRKPPLPAPMEDSATGASGGEVPMEQEGFVLVPENLPDTSPEGVKPVDLGAIFVDAKQSSGKRSPAQSDSLSPSRPATLPFQGPVSGRQTSEPIPVPSQRHNYELIQQSCGQSPGATDRPSPTSPRVGSGAAGSAPRSLSPGHGAGGVQFSVGTPPQPQHLYANLPPGTAAHLRTPPSPRRNSHAGALCRVNTAPRMGESPRRSLQQAPPLSPTAEEPSATLVQRGRIHTCPDIANAATWTRGYEVRRRPLSEVSEAAGGRLVRAGRQASLVPSPPSGALAAQLTQQSQPLFQASTSPPTGSPFSGLPQQLLHGGSSGSLQRAGSNTSLTRVRRYSTASDTGADMGAVPESPDQGADPVFVAPDLAEETLMDAAHNETLQKLLFVLALVECIVEIANVKSCVLSDSVLVLHEEPAPDNAAAQRGGGLESRTVADNRRHEFMLMIRALQLLGATIQIARDEIASHRLHPSTTVKTAVAELRQQYHACLERCKELHALCELDHANMNAAEMAHTTDRIIYTYAIDMCQQAALGEMFGNPTECFHHYRNAHILLHSLAERAQDASDRQLLTKYREAVEMRIKELYKKGLMETLNPRQTP